MSWEEYKAQREGKTQNIQTTSIKSTSSNSWEEYKRKRDEEEKERQRRLQEQNERKTEISNNTLPKASESKSNYRQQLIERIENPSKEEKTGYVDVVMDKDGNMYDIKRIGVTELRALGDTKSGKAEYINGKLENFKENVPMSSAELETLREDKERFKKDFLKSGLLKAGSIYLDSKADGLGSTVENAYNKIEDFSEGTKGIVGNFLMGIEGTLPKASNFITKSRDYITKKATGFVLDKAVDVMAPSESESEKEFKRALTGMANDALHNKLSETDPMTQTNNRMNSEEMQKWRNKTVQSNSEKARELGAVGGFFK